jgi:gliding motility-associated lipoprotein GldD
LKITNFFVLLFSLLVLFPSCGEDYSPKPFGYFRIDLPNPTYKNFNPNNCPFSFDIHKNAFISSEKQQDPCWINVVYPDFKATIHLSYKKIENNLNDMLEDSRTLVYKHTVKASDINEILILDDSSKVYGLVFELEGSTASAIQFYLTDSTNHFIRGALYYNLKPNHDSLAPITNYIKNDIKNLVNSFQWK